MFTVASHNKLNNLRQPLDLDAENSVLFQHFQNARRDPLFRPLRTSMSTQSVRFKPKDYCLIVYPVGSLRL